MPGCKMGGMTKTYAPEAEVVEICRDLIRIDTSNYGDDSGPGERAAAEHVAGSAGRGRDQRRSCSSRRRGAPRSSRTGAIPTPTDRLLLHGHLDVVPAAQADWKVDPFSAEIQDGYIWGRGAVDMKDFDATILSVVRARARAGALPERAITLAFTADEEAGSKQGAHPLIDQQPEWLEGCTEGIGEVGGFSATVNDRRIYLIETAEKGLAWLRLRAHGTAGHGSMRNADNAVTAISPRRSPRSGGTSGRCGSRPRWAQLLDEVAAITGRVNVEDDVDALVEHFGPAARMLAAVVRNTDQPDHARVRLQAQRHPRRGDGQHRRPLPARLRGRVLRDAAQPAARQRQLRAAGARHRRSRRRSTAPIVDAMRASLLAEDPDATVLPFLMSGGTDAKAWEQARHPLLRLLAAAAAGRPRLHGACSTASTSGSRSTRWSSAPACSTTSSTAPDHRPKYQV